MNYSYNAYIWGKWIKIGAVIIVAAILAITSISAYNSLVELDQAVQSQWSQVENVMQRRADLVVNEVETVKGYIKHEQKVLDDITDARKVIASDSADIESKLAADEEISSLARQVLVLVENYPDLKAGELFSNLQEEIEGAENRVSVERKRFIEAVQAYNTKVTRFPGSIFARLMGFVKKDYFKASPEAQKAPEVRF